MRRENKFMIFKNIVSEPDILGGKPCIRGTRISVAFILELFASGAGYEDILKAYPFLSKQSIEDSLLYASYSLKNEYIRITEVPQSELLPAYS